jgi:competence protein ComEA
VALVLAIAAGCCIGAAGLLVAVLVLASPSDAGIVGPVGDVLGEPGLTVTAGDPVAGLTAADGGDDPGRGIVIDVAGAVLRPGLVRIARGDRVGDAIAAAGGFAPRVDLAEASRSLNLAQELEDGAKVVVPLLGSGTPQGGSVASEGDGRIDLNQADQAALEGLPGIGPVTAARIIEARQERPFASVDELRSREVVGEAVFEEIRDLVRASG